MIGAHHRTHVVKTTLSVISCFQCAFSLKHPRASDTRLTCIYNGLLQMSEEPDLFVPDMVLSMKHPNCNYSRPGHHSRVSIQESATDARILVRSSVGSGVNEYLHAPTRDSVLYFDSQYSTEDFPLCYGKYASGCDSLPPSKYGDDFPDSEVTEPFFEPHGSSKLRWYSLLERLNDLVPLYNYQLLETSLSHSHRLLLFEEGCCICGYTCYDRSDHFVLIVPLSSPSFHMAHLSCMLDGSTEFLRSLCEPRPVFSPCSVFPSPASAALHTVPIALSGRHVLSGVSLFDLRLTCAVLPQGRGCLLLCHPHHGAGVALQWSRFVLRLDTLPPRPAEVWTFEGLVDLDRRAPRPTLRLRYTDGSECYLVFAARAAGWALQSVALLLPRPVPVVSPSTRSLSPPPRSISPPPHSISPPPHSISPPPHSISQPRRSLSPPPHSISPPPHSISQPRRSLSPPPHSISQPRRSLSPNTSDLIAEPHAERSASPLPLGPLATAWIERQAKNRTKSRRLQALIAHGDAATYREYLTATLPVLAKLARHPFGNYYAHALIAAADAAALTPIVRALAPSFAQLARDKIGTYVAQALVDALREAAQEECIVVALAGQEAQLAVHPLASHVLRKCLLSFDAAVLRPLAAPLLAEAVSLAQFQYGVVVVKTLFDAASPAEQRGLRERLLGAFASIVRHEFGNYLLQHLTTDGVALSEDSRARVVALLGQDLLAYCRHPHASNVVERLLDQTSAHCATLRAQVLSEASLRVLVGDPFGYYVIQHALSTVSPETLRAVCSTIQQLLPDVQSDEPLHAEWRSLLTSYTPLWETP